MKSATNRLLFFMWVLLAALGLAARSQADDAWKPFDFLLGDWAGSGSGKPREAAGEFRFNFELNRKILVRHNRAQLAARPGENAGSLHEDLMIIYPQPKGGSFSAEYFDNEGHVIHYGVSFGEQKAIFQSDEAANGPKFRLIYQLKPAGVLSVEFSIAPPGKAFQTYLRGEVKKKPGA